MITKDKNLQYIVDVHYTTNFDEPWYSCQCDSICRCLKITSIDGVDVDISELSKNLIKLSDPIEIYGFQRILVANKVYDKDSYFIDYGPNYYGEEIYSVELCQGVIDKIEEDFNTFVSKETLKEKIFFLLELEYGQVLDFLLDMDVEVTSVSKDEIIFPNNNHARISKNKVYPLSNGGKIPLGICRKVKGGISVIDGYNRLSRISEDIENVKVICFS